MKNNDTEKKHEDSLVILKSYPVLAVRLRPDVYRRFRLMQFALKFKGQRMSVSALFDEMMNSFMETRPDIKDFVEKNIDEEFREK